MEKNEDKVYGTEAPDYAGASPKKNRPYGKRAAFSAILAAAFIVYAIFSTNGEEEQKNGGKERRTNYIPALASANAQIESRQREALNAHFKDNSEEPPAVQSAEAEEPELHIPEETEEADYTVQQESDAEEEYMREELALRREWVERQREAFLAPPDADGEWTVRASAALPASGENEGRAHSPGLSLLERLQTQGAQADTRSRAERFFESPAEGGYLNATRQKGVSPYVLPSGTVIQASLVSGINSALPGNVTAMVTANVYDWSDPRVCLIPQGSRLFGIYDSNVDFAQKRIQVKWSRLIYPDGSTIDLGGMAGTDKQGYGGLRDKFYGHYGRMITAAVLTTAFGIIPELIADNNSSDGTYISVGGQTVYVPETDDNIRDAGESVADELGEIGNKYFDKALNVKPTVLVRPGTRFNVVVNKDIPFFEAWTR